MSGDPHTPILRHMIASQRNFIEGRRVVKVHSGAKETASLIGMLRESQVGILAFGLGDAPLAPDRTNISPPQYDAPAPPVLAAPVESSPLVDALTWAFSALKKATGGGKEKKGLAEDDAFSKKMADLRAAYEGTGDDGSEQEDDDVFWGIGSNQTPQAAEGPAQIKKEPKPAATSPGAGGGKIEEESSMQDALSKQIKSAGSAPVPPKEQVREAAAAFERLGVDVDYVKRVVFDKEVYGIDANERIVGPFFEGIYLQTDAATGLDYFSVALNSQKFIIAAIAEYRAVKEIENYDFGRENHSGYLVKHEPINAATIRQTASSMHQSFIQSANKEAPYPVIRTDKKMDFYTQGRRKMQQSNFAFLGYDQKQEIYYYITWAGNNTKGTPDYAATKTTISGTEAKSDRNIIEYKKPFETFFDAALIDVVAPLRRPTNARIRILLRCH